VRSPWEFLVIAIIVTVTPGPGTATILRVAGRDGRRAATSAIFGNSIGVLFWGSLSAIGVSSLILASQIAYDVLRLGGAAVLVLLGIRSLFGRDGKQVHRSDRDARHAAGWRIGLLTSVSNPKLAAFFVALLPQFLRPGAPVLPIALAMAATVVLFDVIWFSSLAFTVEHARRILGPRIQQRLERLSGAVMIGFGLKLASEAR
jgi:threonine/homoserine/homoserine lactone efflux protein